jgi:hypothetical protein
MIRLMFRFTIRDVLWLTVVVGLVTGWGIHAYRSSTEILRLRSHYLTLKGIAQDLHGWTIREAPDGGVIVNWPFSPPASSGQTTASSTIATSFIAEAVPAEK